VKANNEYLRIFHLLNEFFKINKLFDKHVLKWPRYYGMCVYMYKGQG
jgi:hypothetical protein